MTTVNISLTLPQDQVQLVINALNQLPHGQVRDTIDSIVEQANAQMQPAAPAKTEETTT